MQLREMAERVLFGDALDDKLVSAPALEDDLPGAPMAPPPLPGRPEALRLDLGRPRVRFPRAGALADPLVRGQMLHFFANHELMALELMALVLLRFPDAPAKWRRGMANTLQEEQLHLTLYLERMGELGVAFGELPVNRFFWDHLSCVADPRAFSAQMGLVFEQANLDHCLHYAALCREHGDDTTAALLDRVYRDELGHVRHGLSWFRRWKPEAMSLWEAWQAELSPPISVERAKGVVFSETARREVGFDEDYIRRLALSSHSKGRPPTVRWFTAACEAQVEAQLIDASAKLEESKVERVARVDLELLPLVFSRRDDAVLVSEAPSLSTLERLSAAGFALPELVVAPFGESLEGCSLASRKLGALRPWGWSPAVEAWLRPLGERSGEALPKELHRQRPLWDKRQAAAQLRALLAASPEAPRLIPEEALPIEVTEIAAVDDALAAGGTWVAKRPFSTAGRGARRLREALSAKDRAWLEAGLAAHGSLRLEPWLERVADLSIHYTLRPRGPRLDGVTRFFTTAGGRYRGSVVGPWRAGMAPELLRFLSAGGRDPRWLQRLAVAMGEQLQAWAAPLGFSGALSVDAMLVRVGGALRLHPLVEVNPRVTMGRVALRLAERLAPRRVGLFVVLSPAELRAAGAKSFSEMAAGWASPRVVEGRLEGGVLALGDPERASGLLPAFVVGEDLGGCWAGLGLGAAPASEGGF